MIFVRWILSALTIVFVAYLVPGIEVASFFTALVVALVLGLFNAVIRPVLIVLTLPVTVLSLGLFVFVINALLLLLVNALIKGFNVDGFGAAFIGALLIWGINWLISFAIKEK